MECEKMNVEIKQTKKRRQAWIDAKRASKRRIYATKEAYISDDLEHLFKPYGCEK